MSESHAVAAGHALTARTASDVLEAGGSAMDAAFAAALTAMVAEPVLAGVLGGGFAMVREPGGRCRLLDAFVQTPAAKRPEGETDLREIHADFGSATQGFHIGAGTIAASGLAAGLAEAHARYGRMDRRELAAPAARAAREGVEITPYQARLARIVAPILTASRGARALHCEGPEEGAALKGEGARFANPELADVFEEFAAEGPRFVQEGEIATALAALCESGGHLTRADLAAYEPAWREPLVERRGAAEIALNPGPSLGGALIALTLSLLGGRARPAEIAAALATVARARAAAGLDDDPEGGAARLLDPAFRKHWQAAHDGRPAATRGTTHISVIDGDGLGVALTLSNGEGCGHVLPGTGIMPNNMLGEDDLVPGGGVAWRSGVRLASMMCPLSVAWPDGRVAMLGSGGSNRIRTALVQVLLHLVDGGLPLAEAIAAPRLHVEGTHPPALDYEEAGLAGADREALRAAWPEARGWEEPSMFFGGVHGAIGTPSGLREAAGDARRAGHAIATG
jgi:gamma-glutamyltranspeptidase/glutathione hydrolase